MFGLLCNHGDQGGALALSCCPGSAHAPLIDSFLKSKIPRDRKEAYPLPQCVLHHWGRRVLDRRSSQSEVLTLGGFLMTAWASLRFADAQRVEFSSLFLDADALRGICYATKTSFLGQPFGVIRGGLLSTGSHDQRKAWQYVIARRGRATSPFSSRASNKKEGWKSAGKS